jgi:hypothetical protein
MEFPEVGPNEYVVVVSSKPDGMGRVRFTAFWQDENAPQGVRGQVFNTRLADFTDRADRDHMAVRQVG